MMNNIGEDSKRWLSLSGGIVTLLETVLLNIFDPLGIRFFNPALAKFFYATLLVSFSLLIIWLWLVLKWSFLSLLGCTKAETTSKELTLGIKIFSKKKKDLSDVNVELVRLSNLSIGNEHKFFVKDDNISSETPLQEKLFVGKEDGLVLRFFDDEVLLKYLPKQGHNTFGDNFDFIIKVVGKFDDSKHEFTEYYKGSFLYFFRHDMNSGEYKSGQIRWTHKGRKHLKRTFKILEDFRSFKRLLPTKYRLVKFKIANFVAKIRVSFGRFLFKIKEKNRW